MNSSSYKIFLRHFYLTSFFYDFIFAYAIYTVLFSFRGLSVWQIALLLAWWAVSEGLLEIPSGALADRWSRQKMLAIAPLIKALCFLTWFLADGNFYLYALGFLFWSIGSSWVSGTSEALLYDKLAFLKKKKDYEKVLGREKFYFNIALGISAVSGGFIAHYSLNWTVLVSIVPLLLSAWFAFQIKEAPKAKATGEVRYLEYIKTAYREVKTNKMLTYLLAYALAISILGDLEEFDQLYFKLAKLPIFAFGIAGFLGSALTSLGCFYAYKLKQKEWVYYLFPLISAGLFLAVGVYPSLPMISLLLLAYFITAPLKVLIESRIQHNIKSISRATVTSVNSLLINFFGVFVVLLWGVISKVWNLQAVYLVASWCLLLFAGWVMLNRRKFAR